MTAIFLIIGIIFFVDYNKVYTNVSKETQESLNGEYICHELKHVFRDNEVDVQSINQFYRYVYISLL